MARKSKASPAHSEPDTSRPENFKVGQRFGTRMNGEANYIKELNELCAEFEGPHVHVLTLDGPSCHRFSTAHTTYSKGRQLASMYGAVLPIGMSASEYEGPRPPAGGAAAMMIYDSPQGKTSIDTSRLARDFVVKGTQTGRIPPQRSK